MPHADVDDYFWLPTDPPYVQKRPRRDRVALMERVFLPRPAWVLSGWMLGWGDSVVDRCDAIVFLTLESSARMQRLESRELARYGAGAVDEAFLTWARGYDDPEFDGRSRVRQEAWLAELRLPVLRLDSTLSPAELVAAVLSWEPGGQTSRPAQ